MFEQYQLNNKAKVVLIPQNNTRSVTVLVVYPVGSRYETKQMNGVSHYIEHLMFKGTKKRKSTLILTREIDRLGAEYNAFTGKENTGYYIKTDYEYVDKSLDILSDMLYNSVFDPKEIKSVLVTHAHLDHIGRIPKLVKEGFRGQIFMTKATKDFARLIWDDAYVIMKENNKKHGAPILFSESDVAEAHSLCVGLDYSESIEVANGVKAIWKEAGHIFGSAFIEIEAI